MRHANVIGLLMTVATLAAACGGTDSVGSLEGDQGAATGLTDRVACRRFDDIMADMSRRAGETRDRLEELADATGADELADEIRAAADQVGGKGADDPAAPDRCDAT